VNVPERVAHLSARRDSVVAPARTDGAG